jgi:CO dehydrogenase maturation factor
MLESLKLDVKQLGLIVTRAPEQLNATFLGEAEEIGIPLAAIIPDDPALLEFDMEKRSLLELPEASLSVAAVNTLLTKTCPL